MGLFQACAQYYRFAATEAASEAFRPRAIGMVIGGGVVAAVAGPTLATWARDLLAPHTFAGSYLAVMALALASTWAMSRLHLTPPAATQSRQTATPLRMLVHFPVNTCT